MILPWRIDLSQRQLRPEWMDRPDVDPREHAVALRALERVNWISGSHYPIWRAIRALAHRGSGDPIRVLDVACGGGDITVNLARAAKRARVNVTVAGCDLSETAIAFASQRAAHAGMDCRFFRFDVLHDAWPTDYDVIYSSLFLHHLESAEAESVLTHMGRSARRMVIVNDLVRGKLGYFLARVGCLVLTRSPIVHYDGPVSVAGAFTPDELREMAVRSGMSGATVSRVWPQRMLLVWNRP